MYVKAEFGISLKSLLCQMALSDIYFHFQVYNVSLSGFLEDSVWIVYFKLALRITYIHGSQKNGNKMQIHGLFTSEDSEGVGLNNKEVTGLVLGDDEVAGA